MNEREIKAANYVLDKIAAGDLGCGAYKDLTEGVKNRTEAEMNTAALKQQERSIGYNPDKP
jgi:hypothetical protein